MPDEASQRDSTEKQTKKGRGQIQQRGNGHAASLGLHCAPNVLKSKKKLYVSW